jgi:uncharacterized protein (TIGR02231 family)
VEVTVFHDGARVLRRGTVSLETGVRTVVVPSLPSSVEDASVRVVARGRAITLRDVEVRRDYRAEAPLEQTMNLQEDVDRCRDAVQALVDETAVERARLAYLGHLSEAAATAFARAVGFGRAERAELVGVSDELAGQTGAALGRQREIAARRRVAERELEVAEERLASGRLPPAPTVVVEVHATLDVTEATQAILEVSYHVAGADWRPLYDLRLQGERVAVTYLAEISQRSGEDWPEVPLTLSTTRRGRHNELPELSPWYIGRSARTVPLQMTVGAAAAARRAANRGPLVDAAPAMAPPSAAPPAEAWDEAAPLAAATSETGVALVYRVPNPMPVPSDGAPHKTTVARFELDASLDYLTIPLLACEAYLRATVTNNSDLLLMPGPAQVFHEDEYVGTTLIGTVAPGEELELQLGVDDRVRVERELRRRTTSKALIGGTRNIDVVYEITVENHRSQIARVAVKDRVPLSRDAEVKVRVRETTPKPSAQDDLGILTWELVMEPSEKANVRFSFTVEHPADVIVGGL